ncbi:MAG: hypothetical protein FWG85_06445 [Bacteroidetes bacterium]|nr:hypothetical protein [Bacteroidota bacterium]
MLQMIKQILLLTLIISTTFCFAQQSSIYSSRAGTILPITFIEIAGKRPIIEYFVNNKKATSMIHSNANLYIRFNYENSQYFGIENLVEIGEFGISEPGKTNKSYKARINEIKMGSITLKNKEVSIFETYPPDEEGFGMLGRNWIRENNIIIDFGYNTVSILPDKFQQDSIVKRLLKDNYVAVSMELDETDNSYYTDIVINNQKTKFLVSTVTKLIIDSVYAKTANIETGEIQGSFAGPSGKTGNVYSSKENFAIKIGEFETNTNGSIYDEYIYSNKQRPDDTEKQIGGTLGVAFLIEQKAVIDFGNLKLYLKNAE